jgi:UDP-N-acetylglucosamine 2-epimerase
METLYAMRDLGMPALWFWPNVDAGSDGTSKGIRTFREFEQASNIHFFKNMWPEDFLSLVYNSKCIVGNSSMAIRECAYLGVPAVNIGIRQTGRERVNNVIDVDHERSAIKKAVCRHLANGRYSSDSIYGNGKAGQRIADLLAHAQLNIEKRLSY